VSMSATDTPSQPCAGASPGDGVILAGRSGRAQLCYVHPDLIRNARARLRAQTADCVMETFGISVNTWVKMRDGKPIRMSVAERFVQRVGAAG